jgi:hypothetical protein
VRRLARLVKHRRGLTGTRLDREQTEKDGGEETNNGHGELRFAGEGW